MKQKVVLSVEAHGDAEKSKVLQAVTSRQGIDKIDTGTDGKKLTVTVVGTMDVIDLVNKLRKHWSTDMIKTGPVQEEKKIIQENRGKVESLRKQLEKQKAAAVVWVREYKYDCRLIKMGPVQEEKKIIQENRGKVVSIKPKPHDRVIKK